jgi:uncharacterized protein (TIGR03067 family)
MRRTVWLLAALLALPSLGSDAPREYDGAANADELEGTWAFVMGGIPGAINVDVPGLPTVQTFRRGKWEYRQGGEVVSEGVYATDTSRNPATLDEITKGGGQAVSESRMIYRIDDDTLRTAQRVGEGRRPKRFDEGRIYIAIWKRVK